MSEKKGTEKIETKAGMLKDDSDSEARSEKENNPEKGSETTPKISKKSAEGQHEDKPIH